MTNNSKSRRLRAFRELGVAGFLFFLAKGMLWLLAPGVLAWWM